MLPRLVDAPIVAALLAGILSLIVVQSCLFDDDGFALSIATGGTSGAGGSSSSSDATAGRGGTAGSPSVAGAGGEAGAGGAIEQPCATPDCVLWLRADRGVLTQDGGQVSAWLDQSGSNFHAVQDAEAHRPTLKPAGLFGHDALDFVRAEFDFLDLPTFLTEGANATVVAVFDQRSETTTAQILLSTYGPVELLVVPVTPGMHVGARIAAPTWIDVAPVSAGGQLLTWVFWGAGNMLSLYRGRTLIGAVPYYDSIWFGVGTTVLGKYRTSALVNHIDALIAEVIVYDAPLEETELTPVWQYLEDRYGL